MLHVFAALASAVLAVAWGWSVSGRWWHGVVLAALLATAPVFVAATTASAPALLPLPFALTWLLGVDRYGRTRRVGWFALAGAALGAGLYVHNTAVVLFPCFAVLTIGALADVAGRPVSRRDWLAFGGIFALAALPLAVDIARQADHVRDQVLAYGLYDARRFNPLQGAREVFSWVGLSARTEIYWDYLDPVFVFLSGRVFWWPFALLMPVGLIGLYEYPASVRRLAVAGFLLTPIAGALLASPPVPSRMILAAPFAAVLAAHGLIYLPLLLRRRSGSDDAVQRAAR